VKTFNITIIAVYKNTNETKFIKNAKLKWLGLERGNSLIKSKLNYAFAMF
jgi:hypothetical protein